MQSRPLLKTNHLLILPSADTENKASTFSSPVTLSSCRVHLSCHTGPKCLLGHLLHRHIHKYCRSNNIWSISECFHFCVSCKSCTHTHTVLTCCWWYATHSLHSHCRWQCCHQASPQPADWDCWLRTPEMSQHCHSGGHAQATAEDTQNNMCAYFWATQCRRMMSDILQKEKERSKQSHTVGFLRDQQHTSPGFWLLESNSLYPTAKRS